MVCKLCKDGFPCISDVPSSFVDDGSRSGLEVLMESFVFAFQSPLKRPLNIDGFRFLCASRSCGLVEGGAVALDTFLAVVAVGGKGEA